MTNKVEINKSNTSTDTTNAFKVIHS